MNILDRIQKGATDTARRILLYGVEGIGKSTFAAGADNPLFICAEDGLGPTLAHVPRINVSTFQEILDAVAELLKAPTLDYKALALDTADMIEQFIYEHVCKRDGKAGIEDYGYGKGYTVAKEEMRILLAQLDRLRRDKGMTIILLAHATVKPFNNPAGDNYDRYIMKGNDKIMGLLKEWADSVFFARYEVFTKKERGSNKTVALGNARVFHTNWTPAWDAKNRDGLAETLPLDYSAYAAAVGGGGEKARELAQYIADHFESAEWPKPELKAQFSKRLGNKMDVASLAKQAVKDLEPAENYLRTLQPGEDAKSEAA